MKLSLTIFGGRSRVFGEAAWIAAGQIATVIGGLVLVRVLTEYLEPSLYGMLMLGLALASLVNQILMSSIKSGIERFYSIAERSSDIRGYLVASCHQMGLGVSCVLLVGIILIIGLAFLDGTRNVGFAVSLLLFAIVSSCHSTLSGLQNAARQRALVAFHSGVNAWLKIGFAGLGIAMIGTTATAVVIGYMFAAFLVTVSQFLYVRKLMPTPRRSIGEHNDWSKRMWEYSWPFSAWAVFTWIQQVSDRWALEFFGTTADVGMYAVAFQLGYAPMGLLTNMMITLIGPILFQRTTTHGGTRVDTAVHTTSWRISIISLLLTTLAAGVAYIFNEDLFRVLVAEQYRSGSTYLHWLVMAGGIFAAGQVLSLKLMAEMRTRNLLFAKIGTAACGAAFNLLGAALYGIAGVIAGLVIFSSLYFVWMAVLTARKER